MKFHCISHEVKINIASYEITYMYTDIHTYIVFLYMGLQINHISDYFTEQCLGTSIPYGYILHICSYDILNIYH